MSSTVRIVHAAQCRLDVPARGLRDLSTTPNTIRTTLEDATLDAFDRLIERTIENEADVLLLVGNTLRASDRSLRARRRLEQGLARLDKADIASVIAPGPWHRASAYSSLHRPESTCVLSERRGQATIEIDGRSLKICLAGESAGRSDGPADWTVAAVPPTAGEGRSSDSDGRSRRSKSGLESVRVRGAAYHALGYGVATSVEMPDSLAFDPGPLSPTDLTSSETNGAAVVEIDAGGSVRTRRLPCSPVVCEEVEVSVDGVRTLESLAERMSDRLPTFADSAELTVVNWRLSGSGPVLGELSASQWRELIELVDDEAGRSRLHLFGAEAGESDADEIASMLIDEFYDRLSADDLDPRDELEEIDSPAMREVLSRAAGSSRTLDRTRQIGATVFAENCGPLWDAA